MKRALFREVDPINHQISNRRPGLKAQILGQEGGQGRAFRADGEGRLLLSPSLVVPAAADDLDIRSLDAARDSVLVTASGLDIRPLSGASDSVTLYGNAFVEDTISTTVSGTTALLTRDISLYRENSFFIRNQSLGASLTLAIQVAPVNDADLFTTIAGGTGSISGLGNFVGAVTIPMRFARLQVTVTGGGSANVVAYYFGRA